MVAPHTVSGESFDADKPRVWADRRLMVRPRQRSFDLHPDGERVAVLVESQVPRAQALEGHPIGAHDIRIDRPRRRHQPRVVLAHPMLSATL